MENLLRERGLRVTEPRLKILQVFQDSPEAHLRAEDVLERLNQQGVEVALATIYRVLTQFEGVGLLARHQFESDCAVYEWASSDHHDHCVCLGCGKIEEFVDTTSMGRLRRWGQTRDFQLVDYRLTLFGYCKDCQQRE